MRFYVKSVKNLGGDCDTKASQSKHEIELVTQTESNANGQMILTYYDHGNNAEYESRFEPKFNYDSLLDDDFSCALHEFLDDFIYDFEMDQIGTCDVYEYNWDRLTIVQVKSQYFTYCPVTTPQHEALEACEGHLKAGHVVVVSKLGDKVKTKVVPFRGTNANSYGSDLLMYQIEKDGSIKEISCGNFN